MRKITLVLNLLLLGIVGAVSAQTIPQLSERSSSVQLVNKIAISSEMQSQIQEALNQRTITNPQTFNRPPVAATYVGSFNTSDGPNWTTNPAALSAVQAAALIFGGSPADYAISTNPNTTDPLTITETAWATTWGISGCQEVAEDYFLDLGAPGYNDPGGANTAISAYVNDNCIGATNYVWLIRAINCPGNITVSNDPGICGAVVNYTVTANDPVNGAITPTQTAGLPSGSEFPIGVTTNIFEVTYSNGDTESCSFDVIVNDTEAPVLICPANITQSNDAGECGAVVNYTYPQPIDNCNSTTPQRLTQNAEIVNSSVDCSGSGILSGHLRIYDIAAEGVTTDYFVDNVAVGVYQSDGTQNMTINFYLDNQILNPITTYASPISNTVEPYFTTSMIAPAGNTFIVDVPVNVFLPANSIVYVEVISPATAAFLIGYEATLNNETNPGYISCDAAGVNYNTPSAYGVPYSVAISLDGAAFNGLTTIQTAGLEPGSTFPVGTTINTFEVTDAGGNISTCSFNVVVEDTEAPVANCVAPFTVQLDALGNATINASDVNNGSTDNCGIDSITFSETFTAFAEVSEGQNLTITLPGGAVVESVDFASYGTPNGSNGNYTLGGCHAANSQTIVESYALGNNSFTIPATNAVFGDPCGGTFKRLYVTVSYSTVETSETFTCSDIGDNTLTLTVTDANGNASSCTTVVTVEDSVAPVANCAAPFTIQLDANGSASITVADIENGSTDACGIASTTIDIDTFDCSNVGDNTVTLTVTDVNGNVSTCTTVVTVEDNVAPIANCAAPFTIQLDANGNASITVADIENGSTDACGIASTTIDITDFDCSNVGPNTVTLTVTDVNGNVSTCTTVVTVEDSIAPTIVCPANITANTDAGDCFATVSFSMPIAIDNCGIATVVQTMGDPSGSQFPVGVSTIEFTATDVNGNTNTCSFTITVTDNEAPVAVCQNITIQLDASGNATITAADVDGGSTDQCGVAGISIDTNTFDCSNVGDNNVILTVTDVNGNTSTCTAIVTVEDVTAPVVACQNITVELDPITGTVTIDGTDIDNGSTDACGIASYDLDINTFDCSNIGDNTVVLTVTDVNGNTETCTAIVTIEDNTSPLLVCQDFTLELGADGTATLSPSDVILSNDDACGILTTAVDITQFSCADIGTPVTVQVFSQDNNGNLSTCTAVVTVVDNLAPVVTCPADQTVDPGVGNLFYILPDYFAIGEATAVDNCTDPVTITTQDPAVGTPLSDGTYTITLTATDEYGNTSTCEFELTVESILGVGDNSQNLGTISMYPNPAKGNVTIGNPQSLALESANIYDLTGRLVQTFNLKGMATAKTLNVDNLAAATYVVIIKGKEGQITKRLIKE